MAVCPEIKTAKGNNVKLQYAECNGNGKTVLCIHGLTANCRCWDGMIKALSPDHRMLALDLRGRGGSGRPETGYSLAHHVSDIRSLMDDLGIERVALMGHSLGAFITLAFAARFPDRVERLVLVDGGGRLSKKHMDKVMEGIRPALLRLGVVFPTEAAYLNSMQNSPVLQPWNSVIETCFRYEIENVEDGVRCNIDPNHIMEESESLRKTDVRFFYPHVQCETLILRATLGLLGDDDILLPEPVIAGMLQGIPKAERLNIEGLNHYGIVFQPNPARDRALREFLAG